MFDGVEGVTHAEMGGARVLHFDGEGFQVVIIKVFLGGFPDEFHGNVYQG